MSKIIGTNQLQSNPNKFKENNELFNQLNSHIEDLRKVIYLGGGKIAIQNQHNKQRLTARERINKLVDDKNNLLEIGTFASYGMYEEFGSPPCAGIVAVISKISGIDCMIIANDATVKAGAYFEISLKKTLRCQTIALENNLPIVYLVDSAGVFLPLQDQVFPDENHFGKVFFNNARLSAIGIPQIACVMGPCVAGGAYLPVMCDKYIIIKGASMFLAGPSLVKAAIGQEIDQEDLGGAFTHSAMSGTTDYIEDNDIKGIDKIRELLSNINFSKNKAFSINKTIDPIYPKEDLNGIFNPNQIGQYDIREIISRIVDGSIFNEFKSMYGKTIVCGHARIGGFNVGIVANQKKVVKNSLNEMQLGGVIYSDSADKAARFVMNCNQDKIPIIFLHDVNGFMVGKDAEWGGIAKDGAKLVNAVSNSVVPKITVVLGGSYGAGNYALSGRSYNPRFMYAWPSAKIAVMGGEQAAKTLTQIKIKKMGNIDDATKEDLYNKIKLSFEKQSDVKYGAARMWLDEIILPQDTRDVLIKSLNIINNQTKLSTPNFGVLQV